MSKLSEDTFGSSEDVGIQLPEPEEPIDPVAPAPQPTGLSPEFAQEFPGRTDPYYGQSGTDWRNTGFNIFGETPLSTDKHHGLDDLLRLSNEDAINRLAVTPGAFSPDEATGLTELLKLGDAGKNTLTDIKNRYPTVRPSGGVPTFEYEEQDMTLARQLAASGKPGSTIFDEPFFNEMSESVAAEIKKWEQGMHVRFLSKEARDRVLPIKKFLQDGTVDEKTWDTVGQYTSAINLDNLYLTAIDRPLEKDEQESLKSLLKERQQLANDSISKQINIQKELRAEQVAQRKSVKAKIETEWNDLDSKFRARYGLDPRHDLQAENYGASEWIANLPPDQQAQYSHIQTDYSLQDYMTRDFSNQNPVERRSKRTEDHIFELWQQDQYKLGLVGVQALEDYKKLSKPEQEKFKRDKLKQIEEQYPQHYLVGGDYAGVSLNDGSRKGKTPRPLLDTARELLILENPSLAESDVDPGFMAYFYERMEEKSHLIDEVARKVEEQTATPDDNWFKRMVMEHTKGYLSTGAIPFTQAAFMQEAYKLRVGMGTAGVYGKPRKDGTVIGEEAVKFRAQKAADWVIGATMLSKSMEGFYPKSFSDKVAYITGGVSAFIFDPATKGVMLPGTWVFDKAYKGYRNWRAARAGTALGARIPQTTQAFTRVGLGVKDKFKHVLKQIPAVLRTGARVGAGGVSYGAATYVPGDPFETPEESWKNRLKKAGTDGTVFAGFGMAFHTLFASLKFASPVFYNKVKGYATPTDLAALSTKVKNWDRIVKQKNESTTAVEYLENMNVRKEYARLEKAGELPPHINSVEQWEVYVRECIPYYRNRLKNAEVQFAKTKEPTEVEIEIMDAMAEELAKINQAGGKIKLTPDMRVEFIVETPRNWVKRITGTGYLTKGQPGVKSKAKVTYATGKEKFEPVPTEKPAEKVEKPTEVKPKEEVKVEKKAEPKREDFPEGKEGDAQFKKAKEEYVEEIFDVSEIEVNPKEVVVPMEPPPIEPAPITKPTEVKPTEVKPTEPAPTEVQPTPVPPVSPEPAPVAPTEPAPVEPAPAEAPAAEIPEGHRPFVESASGGYPEKLEVGTVVQVGPAKPPYSATGKALKGMAEEGARIKIDRSNGFELSGVDVATGKNAFVNATNRQVFVPAPTEPAPTEPAEPTEIEPTETTYVKAEKTLVNEESRVMLEERLNDPDVPESSKNWIRDQLGGDVWSNARTGQPIELDTFRGSGGPETKYAPGVEGPTLGKGRYSALQRTEAEQFGPNIAPLTVRLKNPKVINNDADLTSITGLPMSWEPAARHKYLQHVRQVIEGAGHDGVIVNVPQTGDVDASGASTKQLANIFESSQVVEFNAPQDVPAKGTPTLEGAWDTKSVLELKRGGETVKDSNGDPARVALRQPGPTGVPDGPLKPTTAVAAELKRLDPSLTAKEAKTLAKKGLDNLKGDQPPADVYEMPRVGDGKFATLRRGGEPVLEYVPLTNKNGKPKTEGQLTKWLRNKDKKLPLSRAHELAKQALKDMAEGKPLPSPKETAEPAAIERALLPRKVGGTKPPPDVGPDGRPLSAGDVRRYLTDALDIKVRLGINGPRKAMGYFRTGAESIRVKLLNDIPLLAHELGHYLHWILFSKVDQINKEIAAGTRPIGHYGATDYEAFNAFESELLALGAPGTGMSSATKSSTKAYTKDEGVAEYVRFWLTDAAVASGKAPKFHKHFEKTLKKEYPQVWKAMKEARRMIQRIQKHPAGVLIESMIISGGAAPKGKLNLKNKWVQFLAETFDQTAPIHSMLNDLQDAGLTAEIADGISRDIVNYIGGARYRADYCLNYNMQDIDGNIIGPSLRSILRQVPNVNEFKIYLVAGRAIEYHKQGLISGIPIKVARKAFNERKAEYEGHRLRLLDFQHKILDLLEPMLGKAKIAALKKKDAMYVPFHRFFETIFGRTDVGSGAGFVNIGGVIKRRKGSDAEIIDPIESIIKNLYIYFDIALRNNIGSRIAEAIATFPRGGRFGDPIGRKKEVTEVSPEEAARFMADSGMFDQLTQGGVNLPAGMTHQTATEWMTDWFKQNPDALALYRIGRFQSEPKKGIFSTWKNGKETRTQIDDDDLYKSLLMMTSTEAGAMEKIIKPIAFFSRVLRAGAVGWNPRFWPMNLFRQEIQGPIYSKYGYMPGFDGIRGLFQGIVKGKGYKFFMQHGGGGSGWFSHDANNMQETLDDLLSDQPEVLRKALKLINPLRILKNLEAWGTILENSSRISAAMRAHMAGAHPREAANAGKDVGLNFSQHGHITGIYNRIAVFFNASVLDFGKFLKMHKENPVGAMFKGMSWITAPSVSLWYINRDDEEIQNLPAWRKYGFWNINMRKFKKFMTDAQLAEFEDDDFILSFPMPFNFGVIYGGLPLSALDHIYKDDPNAVNEWFKQAMRTVPGGWSAQNEGDIYAPWGLLPDMLRPSMEAQSGKGGWDYWQGRPIVPEYMQDLVKSQQWDENTSETAMWLAEKSASAEKFVFEDILGQTVADPGLSPMIIDHMIRGHTAGTGKLTTKAIDFGMRHLAADSVEEPEMGTDAYATLIPFVHKTLTPGKQVNEFYQAWNRMDKLMKSHRAVTDIGGAKFDKDHKSLSPTENNWLHYVWQFDIESDRQSPEGEKLKTRQEILNEIKEDINIQSKSMKRIYQSKIYSGAEKRELLLAGKLKRDELADEGLKLIHKNQLSEAPRIIPALIKKGLDAFGDE